MTWARSGGVPVEEWPLARHDHFTPSRPSAGAPEETLARREATWLRDRLSPQEFAVLNGHELLALNCTYLGESLAALVFFRDEKTPFAPEVEEVLRRGLARDRDDRFATVTEFVAALDAALGPAAAGPVSQRYLSLSFFQ